MRDNDLAALVRAYLLEYLPDEKGLQLMNRPGNPGDSLV